jgi:hypothetical protein
MRQTTLGLGLAFLLCGHAFAVDPTLLNLVMPDAKVLAGANITSTVSSPTAQFLITKLGGFPLQQSPFADLGFNPLQNVTEILAATAADPSSPGGLLLARGTFPVGKITALATSGANTNWQVTTYGGATLLTLTSKGKVTTAVAFPNEPSLSNSVLIAGNLAQVQAAIDRITNPTSIDAALALTVSNLSAQDEWFVSAASVASLIPSQTNTNGPTTGPLAQVLPLLKSIQGFSGGVKFGDPVVLNAEAVENSAANAGALTAVIKLGLLMVGGFGSNTNGNQELAGLAQILQNTQVTTPPGSNVVDLSLTVREDQIETLINSAAANVKVKPAAFPTQR